MKFLIDIRHPAHAHFFHHPIRRLIDRWHEAMITSRNKECVVELLDGLGMAHNLLSNRRSGLFGLALELAERETALYKIVRSFKPDLLAEVGGIFVAHVGKLLRVPAVAFYDTENATLQNALTYPFASAVVVPRCCKGRLPRHRHVRYDGYHELSYLHPNCFLPNRRLAEAAGLDNVRDTFLIRIVSWRANHDIGERGWTRDFLTQVIGKLSPQGKVIVSSEFEGAPEFAPLLYQGPATDLHHLLAYCKLCVGESATLASEAADLGVPAIYAAKTGRGYTDEQETLYGLVTTVRDPSTRTISEAIDRCQEKPPEHWMKARSALLGDTIDVATFVTGFIERFPEPLESYQQRVGG